MGNLNHLPLFAMCNKCVILLVSLFSGATAFALPDTAAPAIRKPRIWLSAAGHTALWTGSFIALDNAWYADYPKTSFHFFNDNAEWHQMDKAGHVWSAYHVSRSSAEVWKWTGMKTNTAAILGGASGMLYQAIIEMQDAYSADWGFSWGDIGSNIAGSALYVLQETGWKEQRVQIKMSYWPEKYEGALRTRSHHLFGTSAAERVLKETKTSSP